MCVHNSMDLMYDEWSGRYFEGSADIVEKAVMLINITIVQQDQAFLNDFYDSVGLPPITMGHNFGWAHPSLDLRFGSILTEHRRAAVSFSFRDHPVKLDGLDH